MTHPVSLSSLDIYPQRDLANGKAHRELGDGDHFIMKLRLVKFTPEYNALFSGDPHLGTRVHRRRAGIDSRLWSPR